MNNLEHYLKMQAFFFIEKALSHTPEMTEELVTEKCINFLGEEKWLNDKEHWIWKTASQIKNGTWSFV
jgi:hypothetical protein